MGEQTGGVRIVADGLGIKGPRGWAVRGISVDAEPGALIAVEGPSGSGRTCLLLGLTGRMKVSEGTAAVGDARLPKQMAAVRGISALAHVPGVTDLDPALTVAEHLRERALLQRRFGASLRGLLRPRGERAAEAGRRVEAALEAAGLDVEALPKGPRTAVRDLERLEALRLSVALALVGGPRLLGIDDTDLKLSDGERGEVWALLGSLADAGTTVVAVCSEAPEGAVKVSTTERREEPPAEGEADRADETDEADRADQGEEKADALTETGRA
ncbi:ATP-binding cassette domain-containing protein [Streptomyces massasporeus]|uniref:ATP-binding cassette domain-containing protein n=1 Tax=Streptomyces massasporeus TaxID=67324 RepID=UPI0033B5DC0E